MAMVTVETVNNAADALAQQGVPVTVEAVRAALGGGALSTITPLVRAWKARQNKDHPQPVVTTELDERGLEEAAQRVAAQVVVVLNDVKLAAEEAAQVAINAERQLREMAAAQAAKDLAEAHSETDAALQELAEVTESLAHTQAELAAESARSRVGRCVGRGQDHHRTSTARSQSIRESGAGSCGRQEGGRG